MYDNVQLAGQVLARMRDLVAQGWCQRGLARDHLGRWCRPDDPCATQYSVLGALRRAVGEVVLDRSLHRSVMLCVYRILNAYVEVDAGVWHEAPGRTREDVLEFLDRARSGLYRREA